MMMKRIRFFAFTSPLPVWNRIFGLFFEEGDDFFKGFIKVNFRGITNCLFDAGQVRQSAPHVLKTVPIGLLNRQVDNTGITPA